MMYPLRDKKQISKRRNVTRNLIIIGLFVVLSVTGMLAYSGKFFNYIGQPIWKAENNITSAVNDSDLLRTKASVFAENEMLKEENTNMRSEMLDYQILKKENEDLKNLLGRLPTNNNFTLATILVKPNRSPYDTIIVDAGENLGITEGQHVFANGNVPIGEISKVYATDSLVMLYSNPGQLTEAVMDGTNASVELIGRGGGNFEMTVPNDLPFEGGTLIVLPSSKSDVIAIIDSIISRPTDPMKKVILRSPVNVQNLKWVQIKKN